MKSEKDSSPPRSYTCNKARSPIDQRQSTEKIKSTRKHEDVKYKKSEDECHDNLNTRLYTEVQQRNKVPYFKDPVRERDRKRRLYGSPSGRRSRSPTPEYSKRRISHRSRNSPKSRRSVSRNRHRSHSPYRSKRRSLTDNRSRRRSRTRSPSRDRSKRRSSERPRKGMEKDNIYHRVAREESNRMVPPTPVIPLPVRGITDYSCPYVSLLRIIQLRNKMKFIHFVAWATSNVGSSGGSSFPTTVLWTLSFYNDTNIKAFTAPSLW